MVPIETGFLSVRSLADQLRELVQVGDHGIGLDRGVPEGGQRGPVQNDAECGKTRRLFRRRGRRLAGAVGRHHCRLPYLDEIGVLALDVAGRPAGLDISTPDVSQRAPSEMKTLIDMATIGESHGVITVPTGAA